MPEQSSARVAGRARRITRYLLCTLPLCGIPAAAIAQSIPPTLRACAADSDPGRRLDCYDREMARLLTPAAQPSPAPAPPPPPPAAAVAPPPAPAQTLPPPQAATPAAASAAAPAATSSESPAPQRSSLWKSLVGGGTSKVNAHIASLDRSPNAMVLHLDNGQVWQQTGRASGDLTLEAGDSVTIEEHLGSYWLSSRYVSNMKVRPQSQ